MRLPKRDPVESIVGWIRALSAEGPDHAQAAGQGNALGLNLKLDEGALWVIQRLLGGTKPADIRAEVRAGGLPKGAAISEAEVQKLCFLLPHTSIFRPLLGDLSGD